MNGIVEFRIPHFGRINFLEERRGIKDQFSCLDPIRVGFELGWIKHDHWLQLLQVFKVLPRAQGASSERLLTGAAAAAAARLVTDVGQSVLTGRRLGAYQILAPIGAGGMGEVYRARDTRLGREVAIKIVPRAFTADAGRLARFEREARVLASLNHPHIAAIYGIEDAPTEAGLVRALVLELVDGETLAERIARAGSKGLPIKEALDIARQIADALDAAHEKGIVHRDFKPANIKITAQGIVKVLDFGLAKLEATSNFGESVTEAPTITVNDTREGLIVGTAAYMSPEQARGQAVDKRTDIWAFGCVLYEMLTGRSAFARATVTDTVAAVVDAVPDWGVMDARIPAHVRRLLVRCLEKDARLRLRDIGDARTELDEPLVATAAAEPQRTRRRPTAIVVAALVLLAAAATSGWWFASVHRPEPDRQTLDRVAELVRDESHQLGVPFAAVDDRNQLAKRRGTVQRTPHDRGDLRISGPDMGHWS